MKESEFWNKWAKPLLLSRGLADRIESSTSPGIPDVNWQVGEKSGWMELKITKGKYVYFEKFQIPWIVKRCATCEEAASVCIYDPKNDIIHIVFGGSLMEMGRVPTGKNKIKILMSELAAYSTKFNYKMTEVDRKWFFRIITGWH